MGHRIDPDDPINGGVPTCWEWMPPQLTAHVWRDIDMHYWGGVIDRGGLNNNEYSGWLVGPPEVPGWFHCVFGDGGLHVFQAGFFGVPFPPTIPWDCDLPVEFTDVDCFPIYYGFAEV